MTGEGRMPAAGQIAAAMDAYFDGIHYGDVDLLGSVLHSDIRLVCPRDGLTLDRAEYLALVGGRPSPASRGDPRYDELLEVSAGTPDTGHVRARLAYLPKVFTDELVFVCSEGRWQIIAKVWDYDLVPETAGDNPAAEGSQ